MALVPHSRIKKNQGGQRLRPTPRDPDLQKGGVAVDTIQAVLGQALLVLIALAVALFTLLLLLVEADYILRVGGRLVGRWKSSGSTPRGSDSPAVDKDHADRPHNDQEAR